MMITGGQIRAARALLRISAHDLANRTGISYSSIHRAEQVDDLPNLLDKHVTAIRTALEAAGVEFIPENGGGAGVRLRK
ncbi:helix-turn-helix transcriptional regulator [Mesorhizobium sp. CN2-181]|uniref:helix-turn-helix transcriptional regulator n=1 Tax=Mesorhizobium yinganensis TaxID=3157707 RepID=UPI0032B7D72F